MAQQLRHGSNPSAPAGRKPSPPPNPPAPPPGRVQYNGMLSSFYGPEDEFEKWKATPKQQRIARLEPLAQLVIPALLLGSLGGLFLARLLA